MDAGGSSTSCFYVELSKHNQGCKDAWSLTTDLGNCAGTSRSRAEFSEEIQKFNGYDEFSRSVILYSEESRTHFGNIPY